MLLVPTILVLVVCVFYQNNRKGLGSIRCIPSELLQVLPHVQYGSIITIDHYSGTILEASLRTMSVISTCQSFTSSKDRCTQATVGLSKLKIFLAIYQISEYFLAYYFYYMKSDTSFIFDHDILNFFILIPDMTLLRWAIIDFIEKVQD